VHEQQHRPLAGGSVGDPIAVDANRARLDPRPTRFVRGHDRAVSRGRPTVKRVSEIHSNDRSTLIQGPAYGGFSYTKETHEAKIGSFELSVKDEETVNVPIWAGVGAIVLGGLLLLVPKKS
jgi:hypothetical protein